MAIIDEIIAEQGNNIARKIIKSYANKKRPNKELELKNRIEHLKDMHRLLFAYCKLFGGGCQGNIRKACKLVESELDITCDKYKPL